MVKKACSTFVALLAEVSRKGIPSSSAKDWFVSFCPCHLVGVYLGNGIIDSFLGNQIRLVSDQKLVDAFNCVSVDFLQPLLDI
jgi:hypothetical protein